MGKMILMEEFHVTAYAPAGLPSAEYRQIYRTLRGRFRFRLKDGLRKMVSRYPALKSLRVKLSN
jgi:hypothetical protein